MVEKLERDYKALQQSYDDVSTRLNASDSELKALKTEQANLLKKLDDSRRNSTIVQELRDSYEKQLLEKQKEFSDLYDGKLKKLQDKLDEAKRSSSALTLRNVELEASNTSLQASNTSLQKGMAELQKELASRDAELKNKDEQIEAMNKDYKDLKETKVAIEMEITAYRRLMDGDEARSDPQDPTGSPEPDAAGPCRGIQRRRTLIEEDGQNTLMLIAIECIPIISSDLQPQIYPTYQEVTISGNCNACLLFKSIGNIAEVIHQLLS